MGDITHAHESIVKKYLGALIGDSAEHVKRHHISQTANVVRGNGEAGIVGGALGAVHALAPGGLDPGGVPVDAVAAVAAGLGAIWTAGEPYSDDIRNTGQACTAVFAFRQMDKLLSKKTAQHAGEDDQDEDSDADVGAEDPIVETAKGISP